MSLPLTALAQQTFTVDGKTVTHDIFGNGDSTDNGNAPTPNDSSSLTNSSDGNILTVNNSDVSGHGVVGGARMYNGSSSVPVYARNNQVTISGSTAVKEVDGGLAFANSPGTAIATNNTVSITDGTVSGNVFGGFAYSISSTATATGNTVIIDGGAFSASSVISGGNGIGGSTSDFFSNNTLELNSATSIFKAQNFETIKFGNINTANIGELDTAPTGTAAGTLVKMNTQGNNINFGGVISGVNGGVEKNGAGTLTLTGTNTYTGGTKINEGFINFNNANAFGTGNITLNGGGLQWATGNTTDISGRLNPLGTLGGIFDTNGNNVTLATAISGTGGIEKTGDGTLTLSKNNTYTGNTTITDGTLALSGNGSIAASSGVSLANQPDAIFDISGANGDRTIKGLTGGGTTGGNVNLGVNTLIVDIDNNTVNTYNGVIDGSGGLTKDGDGTLILSGNNIYSGLTEVKNGTLELFGSGSISDKLVLYSGAVFNAGNATVKLNYLDVRDAVNWTGNLDMTGGTLNFYVPTDAKNGDIMLKVTGTADITGSTINVGVVGTNSPLKAGDQVVLINAGTLTGAPTNKTSDGSGMGVSLKYEFDILADSLNNQLLATVSKTELNPQTKSFSEARLSQLAFGNQGTDLIAGQGLFAALDTLDTLDTAARRGKNTTVFGAISGGSSRYKTGSHSDVSGVSLIAGLTGNSRLAHGKLTLGAFFEYGNANYDSYNSFVNAADVHGKGDTDYTGGGVLAHFEFNPTARGNAWLESSARFGESSVDFKTDDMFDLSSGQHPAFASDSNYAAAHIGLGYHWNLTKRNGFDLYAQYLWSRQNADTAELTTSETIKFEVANSERLRLGSRFVYNLNPHRRAYAGIAWEHEFDGEANASIFDYKLDTPKLTGDTCKLELGLTLQPTKTCPFTRNLGVQGYTGKREGVAGSVEVKCEF
ncbi:hypothetical protein FACS189443_2010 [Planctomycetales bacterium]|nr:hypothetical protein FACS189443_2010 [Planctomycetales bacterium]